MRSVKELIQQPERAIPAAGEHVRPDAALLARSAVNTLLMAFFYVFMEWVFFITKPSFMDVLSLETKLSLPLMTGLAASLPLLLALALIFVLDLLIRPRWPALRRHLYALPAGLVSACLVLILLDNFTYTLFRFGIVTVPDAGRAAYGLLFAFMVAGFTRYAAGPGGAPRRWKNVTALILSLAALLLTGLFWQPVSLTASAGRAVRRPNIILLSTDGLNAANMSVYGYERDTTPFIRQLAAGSLVAMNHFTNAAHSTGSDVSLLTGKLPLVTRVLYPPDTLQGIDSYQHLPGILRRNGYRTVSLGVPYFVDMNTVNFQEAFDAVNCQATPPNPLEERLARFGLSNTAYLLDTLQGRIADRIRHIYFIEDMTNPIELVEQPGDAGLDDQLRLECLRADLEQARETGQPLFAHVHLMGTHGPEFVLENQVFSEGEQEEGWDIDFYDDTVLEYDAKVRQVVETLQELGLYDNTILVLSSDHGWRWTISNRLPLIIRFPGGANAGEISESTQNLDIAPTLLDYLGLPKPKWMGGDSLLRPLDPHRLILAVRTNMIEMQGGDWVLPRERLEPPFYQFSVLYAIQCQNFHTLNLEDLSHQVGRVRGYVNPCLRSELNSTDEIRAKVAQILTRMGYEVPEDW